MAQTALLRVGDMTVETDAATFDADYQAVSQTAFLLARQLGRSTDEAFDIVQEAALRGWRYRRSRRGDFRPWFLAIVYRLATHAGPRWLTVPAFWVRDSAAALESISHPDLFAALRRLPRRQRAAMWLRYGEDMSIANVAGVLGSSETATKQLLLRARQAMRKELGSREEYNA